MKSDLIAFWFPPPLWVEEGNDACWFPKPVYQFVKNPSSVPNLYDSEVNPAVSGAQRAKVWMLPCCNSEDRMGTWGDIEYELRRCHNCHPAHGTHFLSGYHEVLPLWKARPLTGPSTG